MQRFMNDKLEDEDDADLQTIFIGPYRNPDKTINPEVVRVWIQGREPIDEEDNTAFFTGKFLKGRIEYKSDYPQNPPKFFF